MVKLNEKGRFGLLIFGKTGGIEGKMGEAVVCKRCKEAPLVEKCSDPAIISRRYSVKCENSGCACTKIVYGETKNIAISNWNSYMERIKPTNLGRCDKLNFAN